MRDGRRRAGDVEPPNPLVDRTITNRGALVLAQVLEPGLDDEAFDVTPVLSRILVDSPPDRANAPHISWITCCPPCRCANGS